ncbi:MAG: NAD(P)H-hydrate dehydratase [Candidatus Hodarchaeota archaeon]
MKPLNSGKITSEEMAILDNNSEWLGIPKGYLMECAGYTFASEVMNRGYLRSSSKVAIFCGTGNNGGDGFVIARHLSSYGIRSLVILIGDPDKIRTNEAQLNWNIIFNNLTYSIDIEIIRDSKNLSAISSIIEKDKNYNLIVDGLLGTGIQGKIREPIASTIDLINDLKKQDPERLKVVAIDVPSGLDPNSGKVPDKAVKADLVITFHRSKIGMSRSNEYMKEIIEKSIGIPQEASLFVGRGDLIPSLKVRKIDAFKGQFGKILIIGGSKNYSGAPAYASLTAIHFGCDLVITYVPEVIGNVIKSYSPNMIVRTNPGNWLNIKALEEIKELIDWSNAIVIGPGLGIEKETEELIVELLVYLKEKKKSFVLDADALKLVKNHLDIVKSARAILTPHQGELKIMVNLDLPSYDKIEERADMISALAKKLNTTFVVKGPYDYIINNKKLKINKTGCPEMSIGGTGDVLAGLCASFLATNNGLFESACSASFLNGYIGEYCKKNLGDRFTTTDMIANISDAIDSIIRS